MLSSSRYSIQQHFRHSILMEWIRGFRNPCFYFILELIRGRAFKCQRRRHLHSAAVTSGRSPISKMNISFRLREKILGNRLQIQHFRRFVRFMEKPYLSCSTQLKGSLIILQLKSQRLFFKSVINHYELKNLDNSVENEK